MTRSLACLALAAALAAAGSARAQSADATVTTGAATQYVFRGVGQTDGRAQAWAALDVTSGPFCGGAWASNVDYGDGTEAEIDLYVGARRTRGAVTLDAGVIAYLYPGQPNDADYDYVEVKAAASRAFGPVTATASMFWTPDYGGPADEGIYAEAALAWAVTPRWSLSGAAGVQSLEGSGADYAHWNAGVGYAVTPSLGLDLRYHDTDANFGDAYDPRWVLALKATF